MEFSSALNEQMRELERSYHDQHRLARQLQMELAEAKTNEQRTAAEERLRHVQRSKSLILDELRGIEDRLVE